MDDDHTDRDVDAVVVGDVMLDSWLRGPVKRIAQEAPVPVVSVEATEEAPGGAGNTAANLVALGARVRLIGAVGDDACADRLGRALALLGVDARTVTVPGRRTPHKRRLMVGEQLVARYDEEDREPITGAAQARLLAELERALPGADVVIACDYGGGVCTPAVREALAGVPLLVVDAHAITPWRACGPAVVLPNYGEALELLREDGDVADRVSFLTRRSARLLAESGAGMVVTTLDGEGTLLHRPGHPPYRTYAEPAPDHMATGAGDTYTAAFALWLAGGATPEHAARAAQAAAGVVVRRPGTATCTRQELLRELRRTGGREDGPVQAADRLAHRLDGHRRRGQRIVFTNGCFDVLHRGHVELPGGGLAARGRAGRGGQQRREHGAAEGPGTADQLLRGPHVRAGRAHLRRLRDRLRRGHARAAAAHDPARPVRQGRRLHPGHAAGGRAGQGHGGRGHGAGVRLRPVHDGHHRTRALPARTGLGGTPVTGAGHRPRIDRGG